MMPFISYPVVSYAHILTRALATLKFIYGTLLPCTHVYHKLEATRPSPMKAMGTLTLILLKTVHSNLWHHDIIL